ncbi:hypothetical protein CRI77_03710 [Mycolicibacterium duvalii]|uniref:Uncharacterized protein n=1 Tax=Mycolicibacterium duvalii TaxID=39688 RepID=A0A7I7K9V1_9MYCO|nr:hypothetical protein [Mycolicibacterium duvalii]MCV7366520.1 hypothetical protein [Mycolicibacterium duvalii]PEG43699.1 hypothetical protein CRI77_03710 [Mycolicibacterium duvalii]BBX20349.1 hypothetical protein MDUV_52090 [Mycolicibacterium duvalii]
MFRVKTAVSVALLLLGACLFAPPVVAAAGDQVVRVQDGQVRCLLSSNFRDRGYGALVCGLTNGEAFAGAPMSTGKYPVRLNLAIMVDQGQQYWIAGDIPGAPADDVVLGVGETYQANGWTVMPQELRTLIRNDRFDQEINVAPGEVRKR